ncbi:hypothetical protein GC170_10515 [bacterium]|nr:hypothetical protein [bacterium]
MQISIVRTIVTVTASALLGMTLGGAFGYAAGHVSPGLFELRITPVAIEKLDPVAAATVLGAAGGVFCGGALGAFAILVQMIAEFKRK